MKIFIIAISAFIVILTVTNCHGILSRLGNEKKGIQKPQFELKSEPTGEEITLKGKDGTEVKLDLVASDPTLYVHPIRGDDWEWIQYPPKTNGENTTFLILKEIACLKSRFAKELIKKYKILLNEINCEVLQ